MNLTVRELYIQHLKIAKELSASFSLDLNASINFNNVDIAANVNRISSLKKNHQHMSCVTFYSNEGRGIIAIDNRVCNYLSALFLDIKSTPSSADVSMIINEFFALTVSQKITELYNKYNYDIKLDSDVQSFDRVHFNDNIESYHVIKMSLFDNLSTTGHIFSLIPHAQQQGGAQ